MFKIWFKLFLRKLSDNILNTTINVLGFTLGISAIIIALLYQNHEESYNQWNPKKDEIYRIANSTRENGIWKVGTSGQFSYFKSDIPEVENTVMVASSYRKLLVKYKRKKQVSNKILYTTKEFFDFFPFPILEGNTISFVDNPNHIAISERFAKTLFGDENAFGKSIDLKDKTYFISTIFKNPGLSHYSPSIIIKNNDLEINWGDYMNELFCKIPSGTDLKLVNKKMHAVMDKYHYSVNAKEGGISLDEFKEKYGTMDLLFEPLSTIHLHHKADTAGPEASGNYNLLLALLALAGLLMFISCVNLINLSIATAVQRAKEVGVKKSLGLRKSQLIIQYCFEVIVFCLFCFFLGLILVELLLPSFNSYLNLNLDLWNLPVFSTVIVLLFGIAISIGLFTGFYLANFQTHLVLKGDFKRHKFGGKLSFLMLGLQLSISGFFIIGAFIMYCQMQFMLVKDLGFDKEQTVIIPFNDIGDEYTKYLKAKQVLRNLPQVENISTSLFIPGNGYTSGTNLSYKDFSFNTANNLIDYNYLDFAGITLLKGRFLDEKLTSDTISNILINETCARRIGILDDPIGKKVQIGWNSPQRDGEMTVVGVVKDFHTDGLDVAIPPMFFMHFTTYQSSRNWVNSIQIKLKGENMVETISEIESFWKSEIDQEYPFSYRFLDDNFAKTFLVYQKQQRLYGILTFIVVLISLLGLFALASLVIQRRLKEVAIRKTLGATTHQIIIPLTKQFIRLGVISSLIFTPAAYLVLKEWLNNFVYRIDMPLWPFFLTPVILITLVYTVVGYKAYLATKVDLITYLKFE